MQYWLKVFAISSLCLHGAAGCHVVGQAKECEELSGILKHAAPTLQTLDTLKSPDPIKMQTKGELFKTLSVAVSDSELKNQVLKKSARDLAQHLDAIGTRLRTASALLEQEKGRNSSDRGSAQQDMLLKKKKTSPGRVEGNRNIRAHQNSSRRHRYLQEKKAIEAESLAIEHLVKKIANTCR